MTAIAGFQSDLSITCKTDRNFGNVSAGVLRFPKSRINKNGGKAPAMCYGHSHYIMLVLLNAYVIVKMRFY